MFWYLYYIKVSIRYIKDYMLMLRNQESAKSVSNEIRIANRVISVFSGQRLVPE